MITRAKNIAKLSKQQFHYLLLGAFSVDLVAVVLMFYVHDKHLRSCRDGQLT